MQQQTFEKNPNGGYLNPSKYGGHWGSMDITPQLLAEIQRTGKVEIKISAEKMNQKGEPYIRITAKPYDDSWRTKQPAHNPQGFAGAQATQQPQQQQYAPPHNGGYHPQPQSTQPQQDPRPVAPPPLQSDDIPF